MLALKLLLEGNSIRSSERITDLHRDTIMSLLVLAGEKCEKIYRRASCRLRSIIGHPEGGKARYSPAEVASTEIAPACGNPEPARICTSIVERQSLTIRMQMRTLTRLTNAFSNKWENLWAAYCLHFAYYNFCRIHRTLRVTPAMESNITDRVWTIEKLLN